MQKHFKGFSPCICKLAKNVIFFYYTMEDSLKYCGSNKQESFSFLGTFFTEQKSNILFHYRHNSSPKFLSTNVCLALSSNIQSLREMINVARQEMHSGNSGQPKGMDDTMVENDNTISLISCQLLEIMHVLCCLRWSNDSKRKHSFFGQMHSVFYWMQLPSLHNEPSQAPVRQADFNKSLKLVNEISSDFKTFSSF